VIDEAIFSRLSNYAGLTALVGTSPAGIFPVIAPQDVARPFVVFQKISNERISAMGSDTDIARARFQFTSYAETHEGARDVGKQVRLALQRYSGVVATVTIDDIFIENELDDYDPETLLHSKVQDFEVIHRE